MKVLYSQIKELVPDLQAGAKEVGEALTMTGFMMDNFLETIYQGQTDHLISLEVRQNRADGLSVIGVAREVAAYYNLPLVMPVVPNLIQGEADLKIKIEATDCVKRVLAIALTKAKNGQSPLWLRDWLALYDLNSINLLVDLSNYVMIYTGYASHLLDRSKVSGDLVWRVNDQEQTINSLDATILKLTGGELIIADQTNVLALAGLVGCQTAAITEATTDLIVEMAVYDRTMIKNNSRSLAVITEASNRLSKELSVVSAEMAFAWLVSLIIKETGAQVSTKKVDYYPVPAKKITINFNPSLPERLAGVNIPIDLVKTILTALQFKITEIEADRWQVVVPTERTDVALPEDLAEEVIRLMRYDAIPAAEVPALVVTSNITPAMWYLKEAVRDILVVQGFDEVLSQPLVSEAANDRADVNGWEPIITQNSVNEEFPALRVSIAASLLGQLEEYIKKNIYPSNIFEIGRVFGRYNNEYVEQDNLGVVYQTDVADNGLAVFQQRLESLLGQTGVVNVVYQLMAKSPAITNPHSVWQIMVGTEVLGILAKLKSVNKDVNTYYFELNLAAVAKASVSASTDVVLELTGKLVPLDINLEAASVAQLQQMIDEAVQTARVSVWSTEVVDVYVLKNGIRYTVRIVYHGLSDGEAKALHQKIFSVY